MLTNVNWLRDGEGREGGIRWWMSMRWVERIERNLEIVDAFEWIERRKGDWRKMKDQEMKMRFK